MTEPDKNYEMESFKHVSTILFLIKPKSEANMLTTNTHRAHYPIRSCEEELETYKNISPLFVAHSFVESAFRSSELCYAFANTASFHHKNSQEECCLWGEYNLFLCFTYLSKRKCFAAHLHCSKDESLL